MAITASSLVFLQDIPRNMAGTIAARVNSMPTWGRVRCLLGETAREIGTLIFVFAPLDSVFAERSIDQRAVIGIMFVGVLLNGSGILLEARGQSSWISLLAGC